MKIKVFFVIFIATVMFSSCTTTLQQRRVADELYDLPDRETVRMAQSDRSADTIQKRDSDRYRDNYGYHPGYNGYLPPRYYHDWYYWDFHPYHSPFYGYGYPWYNSWYGYGSAFYGYRPWYGYSYYSPYYYPVTKKIIQRKSAQNPLYNRSRNNNHSIHSDRIRKTVRTKNNRLLLVNPDLRVSPDGRKSSLPIRTVKALDGKKLSPDVRSSNHTTRKYNVIPQNHGRSSPTIHPNRTSAPVYRQPSRSVNRIHHTPPARQINSSSRNRK